MKSYGAWGQDQRLLAGVKWRGTGQSIGPQILWLKQHHRNRDVKSNPVPCPIGSEASLQHMGHPRKWASVSPCLDRKGSSDHVPPVLGQKDIPSQSCCPLCLMLHFTGEKLRPWGDDWPKAFWGARSSKKRQVSAYCLDGDEHSHCHRT